MKAKDLIIIGGAIALFYLYQKNKTKKLSTTTAEAEAQDEATQSGGGGGLVGGGLNGGTTSGGGAVFTGSIKPNSTVKSNTNLTPTINPISATEISIQEGGVQTAPQPAIVPPPIMTPSDSLIIGGITPIVKPIPELIQVIPDSEIKPLTIKTKPILSIASL